MNDDKTVKMTLLEHIGYGTGLSFLTSLFGFMGYATATLSLTAIKRNKEITVQLYDFDDFIRMDKVPQGKKVVFSDTTGFVLCNEEDESEYNDWQGLSKKDLYFFKFKEYYDKYKGQKQEILI